MNDEWCFSRSWENTQARLTSWRRPRSWGLKRSRRRITSPSSWVSLPLRICWLQVDGRHMESCRSWFGCPCGFGCQCSSHSQMIPKLGSVIIFSQTYKLSYIFPRSLTLISNDHSLQKPSPSWCWDTVAQPRRPPQVRAIVKLRSKSSCLIPSFFRCLQQPVHGAWADAVISGVQHVSRDIYRWQYDDLAAETIHEPNINAFQSWCYFYKQCLIATWTSETVSIYLKTNTILLWYIEPSVTCELEDNFYLF